MDYGLWTMVYQLSPMKIIYLLLVATCSSCLRLEAVQQYATEAQVSTNRFNEIELTFRELCQRKRQIRDLRQGPALRTYQDSCQQHQRADVALQQLQTAVADYLTALSALAGGERITYDLGPVKSALGGSGLISLEENTMGAYQSLLEVLGTAATEAYRRRQLTRLVAEAHLPLLTLLDQLTFVADESFREAIEQQQEMQYLNIRELADSAQTFVERRHLWQEYIEEAAYYEQQQRLLTTYAAMLETIRQGHRQLYDQRNRLNRREAVATLGFYLTELRRLQATFAKLSDE